MASQYDPTTSKLFAAASQAIGYASMSAGRISGTAKPNLRAPTLSYTVGAKDFGNVPKFSDLFDGADNADQIIADINDQVDAWLAKYFPSINNQFQNVPEDWCVGVIGGTKPFGVPETVFDMVWQQARDRVGRTVRSEQRTLEETFSSRDFSLPPGALVYALSDAEKRGTDSLLDTIRDAAIKNADVKVELLKQAVAIASSLKQGILNTSAEFFKAYYSVHGLSNDSARIRADAYNSYYRALASYYNVEVAWEQLRLQAAATGADVSNTVDRNAISLYSGDGVASAHAQAARGFADVAAAANAAAGTLVAQIENV